MATDDEVRTVRNKLNIIANANIFSWSVHKQEDGSHVLGIVLDSPMSVLWSEKEPLPTIDGVPLVILGTLR